MPGDIQKISNQLWDAADELRANSKLKSSEYSVPVLGFIFLKFADFRFEKAKKELGGEASSRRTLGKAAYRAKGVLFLSEKARFAELLKLPEGADIGRAINEAMAAIEDDNSELKDILPKNYNLFDNRILVSLLKIFNRIPMDIEGDAFGKIYEYFLGKFAMSEGQKGGEFFTPTSIVKLIVEIIEPYQGRIYDPACGSGGMFVQSAWKSLVHPDDMPKVWAVLEPHLKGETKHYKCRNRLRMKSGLYRSNMDFGKVVVRGEVGEAVIMEGYDISIAS
jgi:type I restriction enzyme M protein